jgi:SOS-response transcriptional repressor LexA
MKTIPLLYNSNLPVKENVTIQCGKALELPLNKYKEKSSLGEILKFDTNARFFEINTDIMEEEGIYKNDVVIINPEVECVKGKIVVAKINNALLIRRYEKIKSGHILTGDTKKISPLKIEEGYDQFKILGVVAFVIKSY